MNVRSVQRVEVGQPASSESTRALACAFDADDHDGCLRFNSVATAEEIAAERETPARDCVEYAAATPASGRALAAATEEALTTLVDYLRVYGERSECNTGVQRLEEIRDLGRYLAQAVLDVLQLSVPDENDPPPLTRRASVED